jgi:hypothetical protein
MEAREMTVTRDELAREMAKEAGWLDSGAHAIVACSTVAMLHVERARAEALEEAAAVAEYHGDWAIAQDIIALKDKDGARDVGG